METSNIKLDDSAKEDMLKLFGKELDEEGFIIEAGKPEQRVITPYGEEIQLEDWGGVRKGSEAFIKKDVFSLIRLAKEMR